MEHTVKYAYYITSRFMLRLTETGEMIAFKRPGRRAYYVLLHPDDVTEATYAMLLQDVLLIPLYPEQARVVPEPPEGP